MTALPSIHLYPISFPLHQWPLMKIYDWISWTWARGPSLRSFTLRSFALGHFLRSFSLRSPRNEEPDRRKGMTSDGDPRPTAKDPRQLKSLTTLLLDRNKLSGPIPKELGNLSSLQELVLSINQLSGPIPAELSRLHSLQALSLARNQLKGPIPKQLSQLQSLRFLFLQQNHLSGPIPKELGELQLLEDLSLAHNQLIGPIPKQLSQLHSLGGLDLHENQLSGAIPRELGRLRSLYILSLSQNQLSGVIPAELGGLGHLVRLALGQNHFSGRIPREMSKLQSLQALVLDENQLSGPIPKELGKLQGLQSLSLSKNQLSGTIPKELGQMASLQELSLAHNQLAGELRGFTFNNSALSTLDLSGNFFQGNVDFEVPSALECLDLSHNHFAGDLSGLVEGFCRLDPVGGMLQELRMNHNKLSGNLPSCLLRFQSLEFLSLNNNDLEGALPEVKAPELVVLALHCNSFTAAFPTGLDRLSRLGVLTLHQNSFVGNIGDVNLTTPCIDNTKFRLNDYGCRTFMRLFSECANARAILTKEDYQKLQVNCASWCGLCLKGTWAKMTLHHNRLSGAIPESVNRSKVLGLAIMGNMLGSGRAVTAPWILREEMQPFLYYSQRVRRSNMGVVLSFLFLLCGALIFHRQLFSRLRQTKRCLLEAGPTAEVASSSITVWLGWAESQLATWILEAPLRLLLHLPRVVFLFFSCWIKDLWHVNVSCAGFLSPWRLVACALHFSPKQFAFSFFLREKRSGSLREKRSGSRLCG